MKEENYSIAKSEMKADEYERKEERKTKEIKRGENRCRIREQGR